MEKISFYDWMRTNTKIVTLLPAKDQEYLKGMNANEMRAYVKGYRSALRASERALQEVKGGLALLETWIDIAEKLQRDGYIGGRKDE